VPRQGWGGRTGDWLRQVPVPLPAIIPELKDFDAEKVNGNDDAVKVNDEKTGSWE